MLAGGAIEHEEVAVPARLHEHLLLTASEGAVDEDDRLRRIPIRRVVR